MQENLSTIKIIDRGTNQILFECPINESSRALREAAQLEEYGVDIQIISPSVTETLAEALGLSSEEREKLAQSSHDEIADHEGSCCHN
jgi:hypothetical protein